MSETIKPDAAPTLPGLELNPTLGPPSPLRRAVQTTLEALEEDGLLEPRHTAIAQLALELADAVGRNTGRASAAAMAAAQLIAALDKLPKPAGLDADAEWLAFVEELRTIK